MGTTAAADKVMKGVITYDLPQVDKLCSHYYLMRQKLYSFLAQNQSATKMSKKKKESVKKKTEKMIPLAKDHPTQLDRLEDIVASRVIPLLEAEWGRGEKKRKQGSSERERVFIERVSRKEAGVDDYSHIIEAFVLKVMEREEKMNQQMNALQLQLQQQIHKCEQLMLTMQNRQPTNPQKQNEHPQVIKYREFINELRGNVGGRYNLDEEESKSMAEIAERVRKLAAKGEERKKSRCQHSSREVHSACKEEASRHEQQIRHLKEVVKEQDAELELLRESYEQMEGKAQNSGEKITRLQKKSSKLITEKNELEHSLEILAEENRYQSKLIEEYMKIIGKFEQSLKTNEETIMKMTEENEAQVESIHRYMQQQKEYLQALADLEMREKHHQEVIATNEVHLQEAIKTV